MKAINDIEKFIIEKKEEIIHKVKDIDKHKYNPEIQALIFDFIFSEKHKRLEKIFKHLDKLEFSSDFFFMDLNSEIKERFETELDINTLHMYFTMLFNNIKNIIKHSWDEHFNKEQIMKLHLFLYKVLFNLSEKVNHHLNWFIEFHRWILSDNVIISQTDKKWIITYVNQWFCKITWYTPDELIWRSHNIVRHPDVDVRIYKDLWNTIQSGKTWIWVLRNKRKDGSSYYVKSYVSPFIINWVDHWYISVRTDVTKLVEMQQKNKELMSDIQKQNISLINTMREAVWIWDKDEKTVYANDNFCKLIWYELTEIIWRKSYDFRDNDSIKTVSSHNELRKVWEVSKYEGQLKTKDWHFVPVLCIWTPIPGGWTIWIMTDLRDIRQIEEEKNEIKRKAKMNAIAYGISLVFIITFVVIFIVQFWWKCNI